jgi:endonuclease YncB( thermonuclease family)
MHFQIPILALALTAAASVAHADPCKAIPDHGPAPGYLHPGATFSGKVVYIGDGDSLCVAVGSTPDQWVEVRLADFYAPELHDAGGARAKAALSRLTYGRQVTCFRAGSQVRFRPIADGRAGREPPRIRGRAF